jgi:plastocyanin
MRKILIVGALVLAAGFLFSACQGGGAAGPVTRDFSIVVGDGKVVAEHGHESEVAEGDSDHDEEEADGDHDEEEADGDHDEEEADGDHDDEEADGDHESEAEEIETVGSFHRWEPAVLVAFKGDTIRLEVTNLRGSTHSFVLKEFLVDTGSLEPQGGTETVEFTVDEAGIFQFACGLEYEDEETGELTGDCAPDHEQMVGYFIVLDR